jgi:hypothetical protein
MLTYADVCIQKTFWMQKRVRPYGDNHQTTPNSQSVTPPHPPLESPYRTKSVVMRRALRKKRVANLREVRGVMKNESMRLRREHEGSR